MTTERRLERDLPQILGDLAMGPYPDYIDDVLATTAHRRQRPAWTFPERWLPMDLATNAVPEAPRIPWRIVAVLALLLVLVAAMLAFYVGAPQRLPAPFGPAANGSVVFTAGGDIYTVDPVTGEASAIVVGPETDREPVYSRDGTRVAFERKIEGGGGLGPGMLFVVQDDGRGLLQVTPEPLSGLGSWSFSPDGHTIVALATRSTGLAIMIVPSDGSGSPAFFDVGATLDNDVPPQYRPDGAEIMFVGRQPGTATRGLYALDPTTGDVRTIIAPVATADVHLASWSPDGTRIAYAVYDPNAAVTSSRTHVVATDGSGDILVDTHPDSIADVGTVWSNDGTRLIVARLHAGNAGDILQSAIVPADGSNVGIEVDCPPGALPANCSADWMWSPDDTVLIAAPPNAGNQLLPPLLADPLTGRIRSAPWSANGDPTWERRAP